jgi:histone H4
LKLKKVFSLKVMDTSNASMPSMPSSNAMPSNMSAQSVGKRIGGKGFGKGFVGKGPKRYTVTKDPMRGITNPAIRRLCRRGGIKRISGLYYDETRGITKAWLEMILKDALVYTEHAKRKTLTAGDVFYALKNHGQQVLM